VEGNVTILDKITFN